MSHLPVTPFRRPYPVRVGITSGLPVNQDFAAWLQMPGFRIVTDSECLTISPVAKAAGKKQHSRRTGLPRCDPKDSSCRDRRHLPLRIFFPLGLENGRFLSRIVDNYEGTIKHLFSDLQVHVRITDDIFNPASAAIRRQIETAIVYGAPSRH